MKFIKKCKRAIRAFRGDNYPEPVTVSLTGPHVALCKINGTTDIFLYDGITPAGTVADTTLAAVNDLPFVVISRDIHVTGNATDGFTLYFSPMNMRLNYIDQEVIYYTFYLDVPSGDCVNDLYLFNGTQAQMITTYKVSAATSGGIQSGKTLFKYPSGTAGIQPWIRFVTI